MNKGDLAMATMIMHMQQTMMSGLRIRTDIVHHELLFLKVILNPTDPKATLLLIPDPVKAHQAMCQ